MANFRSGYLDQGAPLGATAKTVLLVADNTAVDVRGISLLLVGSDNTTATSRTFTISQTGLVGHVLTLVFNTGSSTTAQLADTGIQKLVSDWLPVQYDSITLYSDGTNWIEIARGTSASTPNLSLASAQLFVGNGSGVATGVAVTGDVTISNAGVTAIGTNKVVAGMILADSVTTAKILDANVTLAKLASGITPSHVVKFAGKHTTLGGSATEALTVTGVAATDVVIATLQQKGASPQTILTTAPTTNTITFVFSGDPSTDHIVSYQVLRAAA